MAGTLFKYTTLICVLFSCLSQLFAQQLEGEVRDKNKQALYGVKVVSGSSKTHTDHNGRFILPTYADSLIFTHVEFDTLKIAVKGAQSGIAITLRRNTTEMDEVKVIQNRLNQFDIGYLPPVRGVQIATGTNAIIQTEGQQGAKSSGNPRELFAKIPGINIWESDGAGIQMGVGGRGLSPNRAANFNTRQNGYDISADALGYPESYYTPPLEALSSIEIIRGSASLQYGTQFGGLMNFVLRDAVKDSPFEFTTRNTVGSFGYFGTFNRVSGSHKRVFYQAYHQLKLGDGYRDFSTFKQHQGFAQIGFYLRENHQLKLEFTTMHYDAQQPGGLTDNQFKQDLFQINRERNWFRVNWNILALHYTWEISSSTVFNVRSFAMHSDRYALGFLGKISQVDPMEKRELIAGNFRNAGVEARLLKRYAFSLGKKTVKSAFLAGARMYKGNTTSKQGNASTASDADFTFSNPRNLESSAYDFPSENLSFFTDNIFFVGKTSINAGFRLEYIRSASQGYYKQYSIHPLNYDTLGIYTLTDTTSLKRVVPLFGAGLSRKVGKNTNLYANYCLNYRAVNFNDIRISNPNIMVDTLMKDEYGSTSEIGYRGLLLKHLYIDVAAFYLFYGNKIGLAPEGIRKIRTNIGDAVNYGIETFVEWDFIRTFNDSSKWTASVFANFSYISAHYIRSREANYIGNQVEYVSPILLRTGLKIKREHWSTQIQYSYNSGQYADASNAYEPSADAVIGYIPAYMVFDYSVRVELPKGFQLEGGINNLLNAKYYTRRATAYPGPGILPSDGRSFYFTMQYKFKK